MNKLENLVCTMEQAVQIAQHGVLQHAALVYLADGSVQPKATHEAVAVVDAWTVQELHLLIGDRFRYPSIEPPKHDMSSGRPKMRSTYKFEVFHLAKMKQFKNEPQACADFLLTLLSEGVIEITEVNDRIGKLLI